MLDCSSVTVGVCTYRRDHLSLTLESILKQERVSQDFQVIVVDNDEQDSAKSLVEPFIARYGSRVRYVHAPFGNISIARNAVLDNTQTRWLAFIDDDEIAAYDWLSQLAGHSKKADIVLGPCQAIYGDDAPAWASICDFHSNTAKHDLWNAYTSNVLIDMDVVRRTASRFDLRLGKTGGEDTFFFKHLKANGATIAYAENALVFEGVAPSRTNLRWVLRRKYRSGQTHWDAVMAFGEAGHLQLALAAAGKSIYSLAKAAVSLNQHKRFFWLARAVFHAGVTSKLFGAQTHEEYASAPSAVPSGGEEAHAKA